MCYHAGMDQYLKTAFTAADAAGKEALKLWRRTNHISTKSNWRDLVTKADVNADKQIRHIIQKQFPGHGILSEELDPVEQAKGNEYLWVLDPIDGTINYTMGLPSFAVAIGLLKNGEPVLGVIDLPALGERYWAQPGKGAWMKRGHTKKRCRVSKTNSIKESRFSYGFSYTNASRRRFLKSFPQLVMKTSAARIHYCAAYDFTNIARGGLDFYVSIDLNLWDFAAGWPIVEEAGGQLLNMQGKRVTIDDRSVVATNKRMTRAVTRLLK